MATIHIIRAILDSEEDVIRDIALRSDATLFDLHSAIVDAFDLHKGEMSSFFRSNDDWEQGEEISMMEFDPGAKSNALERVTVHGAFEDQGSKMLFVYDFLALWTFFLETTNLRPVKDGQTYPTVVGRLGTTPEKAPEKEMTSENLNDEEFEDPLNDTDDSYDIEDEWF